MLSGWYVGYVVAAVVITAVVVLVACMLSLTRRITLQALGIADALSEVRGTTRALPLVGRVNDDLGVVVNGAVAARGVLEAGS